jgi:hypothetical protein
MWRRSTPTSIFEAAFLQHGLTFVSAVEAEGHELQLSLISDGLGSRPLMPQVLQSSSLRKRIKPVTVKGLSPTQNVCIPNTSRDWLRLFVAYAKRSSNNGRHIDEIVACRCGGYRLMDI